MRIIKALVLGMLALLIAGSMASAQSGEQWDTSFTVVNLGTERASVTVLFYDLVGNEFAFNRLGTSRGPIDNPFALDPGDSQEVILFLTAGLSHGQYSIVASSDQPIATIANLVGQQDHFYNGSYSGGSDFGSSEANMPSIVHDYYGWNSHLSIQNLLATPQSITAYFYAEGKSDICHTKTPDIDIAGYASWDLDLIGEEPLDDVNCDVNNDGYNGSAVIIGGTGAIAVVDNQAIDSYPLKGLEQAYTGFTSGSSTLYVPALYYIYYAWTSSINVQNIGTESTNVTVAYSDDEGYARTQEIPPKASYFFYQHVEGDEGHHVAGSKFSATITSDNGQPLVAVVNAATGVEHGGPEPGQAQAYTAFGSGTSRLAFPLVMRSYYGWYTSYTIQNVSDFDVTVNISYSGMANCQNIQRTIPARKNLEVYQGAEQDPVCPELPGNEQPGAWWLEEGYIGAVTVQVDGAGQVAGILNQTNFHGGEASPGDWSMSYNALYDQ